MSPRPGKQQAIVEAATEVFLAQGYAGTSIDQIAARAAVSKPTVYAHFAGKETLFAAIVALTVDEAADPVHAEVAALRDTGDVEADLRDLARRQLAMVMRPRLLRLRRLVIGEAGRFPELGRLFAERGPARTIADLAAAFRGLTERGLLAADDADLAAAHFNWLVMSVPLNRAMLTGDDAPLPAAELRRYADEGVRVFLAAYGA
ncbi:TetR/AcrR family transcriptional regulator [Jiangella mangrovi]|uniref:AcrR family transcriptional regulator n=1 Tax=Jiangella mangrovi TaxID=1524084 RepID=A0A7W9GMD2_9ACTN|nr:TetR/AcrR family transcriptional regulator [Jiangella mangrovi]MBB5786323.1 AcrR family transcriptional regulator [Jiangella mangrovi]